MAADYGLGRPVLANPSTISEVDDIRTALRTAADQQKTRERERQIILDETAHRARNQMSLAISLANLTASSAEDVADMKEKLNQRLVSLGRSIEIPEVADTGRHSLHSVIENQLAAFVGEDRHQLRVKGTELLVDRAAAQSLALIFHELGTNAAK